MYYEKWGFMLIFWNLAGVPLSYCHCTIYLASHDPETYRWPRWALASLTAAYLFVYWVWDTCNSQKNMFRQEERGTVFERKTFPHFSYGRLKNPKSIPTKTGDSILCDGWCTSPPSNPLPHPSTIPQIYRVPANWLFRPDGRARKVHYTCDLFFALSWGLVTGFKSPFPWFYPLFFSAMIMHRARRDIERCHEKYGEAWEEYTRRVPWLFIPVSRPFSFPSLYQCGWA